MDEDGLVSNWQQSKRRSTALRLAEQCLKEQEYKRDQLDILVVCRFVRFECLPADSLSFEMDTPGQDTSRLSTRASLSTPSALLSSTCYWLVLQTHTRLLPQVRRSPVG